MSKLIISSLADALNALNNPEMIQDLPEFKTFPAGTYLFDIERFKLDDKGKDGECRPAIEVLLGNATVVEIAHPEKFEDLEAVTEGLTGGVFYKAYFTQAKDSQEASRDMSSFKKIWLPELQRTGKSFEEFCEDVAAAQASGSPLQVILQLSCTKGKKPNDGGEYPVYNNIESAAFPE